MKEVLKNIFSVLWMWRVYSPTFKQHIFFCRKIERKRERKKTSIRIDRILWI